MNPEDARKAAEETEIESWEFDEDTGAVAPDTPLADTIAASPLPKASSCAEPCPTRRWKKTRKMLQDKALSLSAELKSTLEELDRIPDD